MTKGKIFKGIAVYSILFGVLAVICFLLAFSTSTVPAAGFDTLVFGVPAVSMTDLFSTKFVDTLKLALTETYLPALKAWWLNFVSFWKHALFMTEDSWYGFGTDYLIFYMFIAVAVIYVIYVLYYLIFGLFVYKKKKSAVLNIFWTAIPTFVILFLLVGLQGAVYGNQSYADIATGTLKHGPMVDILYRSWKTNVYSTDVAALKTTAKNIILNFLFASIFVVLFVIMFVQIAYRVYYGTPRYLSIHKYDYLEKAEKKRREKFYKNHGYDNIMNQPVDKKDKKAKKNKEDQTSNNPYVQQQQAAMGVTGAPYGQYPYPYGYAAPQPQVVIPPNGGNTVHTGNNAPLIVQYITNGQEGGQQLKNTRVDENTTSIYGTSRQPAQTNVEPMNQLTREDIKSAVLDILKETNLVGDSVKTEAPVEETKPVAQEEHRIEDEYDVLTLDDLKDLIKDSVKELIPEQPVVEEEKVEEKPVETPVVEEKTPIEAICDDVVTEEHCCCHHHHEHHEEVERPIPPIVVAIPSKVEEVVETPVVEEEVEEDNLDEEALRALISAQLTEALKDIKVVETETVKEVPVYVKEVEKPVQVQHQIVKEIIKEVPVIKEVIKEVPVEVKVETPVVTEEPVAPMATKRPLIKQPEIRGKEKELKKVDSVKLSFAEKVLTSGPEMILAYNSLKNLLVSYGLKSRLSNSGDTFRLHKNTYCKITTGGSHLKIYLALDPKNYLNSAIPVGDASFKDLYKDIPLVFRVKSDLSLRRARDLINDCMNSKGLQKVEEEGNIDYASELKNK